MAGALKVKVSTGPDVWATIGGTPPVTELTQAAYDALGTKDATTFYVITDGADRTLLTGTTAPAAGTGIDGDFYINTTGWLIYGPKAGGAWPTGVALAASTAASGNFFKFDWSSATAAPPSVASIRYNNATAASVTNLYVSDFAKDGTDISIRLLTVTTAGDRLMIQKRTDATKYHIYVVSGAPTDNTTYATIPVTYQSGSGTLVDGDEVVIGFIETPASETYAGIVELATAAETLTGTDNVRAIHSAGAFATFAPKNMLVNAQVGTTYTPVLADASKLITLNNASAITFTVPLNSAVAYPIGTEINLLQIGAGQVTVTQTGGVTVNATPSKVFRAQFSMATLIKYGTDTWALIGDT